MAHMGVLLGILLIFLILELAFEWRGHVRGYDTLFLGRASTADTTHSDYPFRSKPVSMDKPAGATRLWIAGASQAKDNYQPLDQIFPSLVLAKLNAQGIACDLINGSEDGTGIEGNLAMLEKYAPQYHPDWVVLYQGSFEIQNLSKLSFLPSGHASGKAPGSWHGTLLNGVRAKLEATSLFAYLQQDLRTRLMAAKPLHDKLPDSAANLYRELVINFITRCRALGAQPVLTTFSSRYGSANLSEFDEDLFLGQLRYNPFLSRAGWLSSIEMINSINRDVAISQKVPIIDVASSMTGRADSFRDFSHFTKNGHARAAEAFVMGLRPLLQQQSEVSKAP